MANISTLPLLAEYVENHWTQTLLWSILTLVPATILTFFGIYIKNLDNFPLTHRPPLLMILGAICLLTSSIVIILHRLFHISCDIYFILITLSENIFLSTILLRSLYSYLQLRALESISFATDSKLSPKIQNIYRTDWSIRVSRRLIRTKVYILIFIIDTLITTIVYLALFFFHASRNSFPSNSASGSAFFLTGCYSNYMFQHPMNIYRNIFWIPKVLLLLTIYISIQNYGRDPGLSRPEIAKMTFILAIAYFITQIFHILSDYVFSYRASMDIALIFNILGLYLPISYFLLLQPVILHHTLDRQSEEWYLQGRLADIANLSDILHSKEGCEAFTIFLKSEFSEENINFWKDVNEFVTDCIDKMTYKSSKYNFHEIIAHKLQTRHQIIQAAIRAMELFFIYCQRGAPQQVNISDIELQSLVKQLCKVNQRGEIVIQRILFLYDSAQSQVFELMDKDSYARFRQSAICEYLKRRLIKKGWIDTTTTGYFGDDNGNGGGGSGGGDGDGDYNNDFSTTSNPSGSSTSASNSTSTSTLSFQLPVSMIHLRDTEEDRLLSLERKRHAQAILPELERQETRDESSQQMIIQLSQLHRRKILRSGKIIPQPLGPESTFTPMSSTSYFPYQLSWIDPQGRPIYTNQILRKDFRIVEDYDRICKMVGFFDGSQKRIKGREAKQVRDARRAKQQGRGGGDGDNDTATTTAADNNLLYNGLTVLQEGKAPPKYTPLTALGIWNLIGPDEKDIKMKRAAPKNEVEAHLRLQERLQTLGYYNFGHKFGGVLPVNSKEAQGIINMFINKKQNQTKSTRQYQKYLRKKTREMYLGMGGKRKEEDEDEDDHDEDEDEDGSRNYDELENEILLDNQIHTFSKQTLPKRQFQEPISEFDILRKRIFQAARNGGYMPTLGDIDDDEGTESGEDGDVGRYRSEGSNLSRRNTQNTQNTRKSLNPLDRNDYKVRIDYNSQDIGTLDPTYMQDLRTIREFYKLQKGTDISTILSKFSRSHKNQVTQQQRQWQMQQQHQRRRNKRGNYDDDEDDDNDNDDNNDATISQQQIQQEKLEQLSRDYQRQYTMLQHILQLRESDTLPDILTDDILEREKKKERNILIEFEESLRREIPWKRTVDDDIRDVRLLKLQARRQRQKKELEILGIDMIEDDIEDGSRSEQSQDYKRLDDILETRPSDYSRTMVKNAKYDDLLRRIPNKYKDHFIRGEYYEDTHPYGTLFDYKSQSASNSSTTARTTSRNMKDTKNTQDSKNMNYSFQDAETLEIEKILELKAWKNQKKRVERIKEKTQKLVSNKYTDTDQFTSTIFNSAKHMYTKREHDMISGKNNKNTVKASTILANIRKSEVASHQKMLSDLAIEDETAIHLEELEKNGISFENSTIGDNKSKDMNLQIQEEQQQHGYTSLSLADAISKLVTRTKDRKKAAAAAASSNINGSSGSNLGISSSTSTSTSLNNNKKYMLDIENTEENDYQMEFDGLLNSHQQFTLQTNTPTLHQYQYQRDRTQQQQQEQLQQQQLYMQTIYQQQQQQQQQQQRHFHHHGQQPDNSNDNFNANDYLIPISRKPKQYQHKYSDDTYFASSSEFYDSGTEQSTNRDGDGDVSV